MNRLLQKIRELIKNHPNRDEIMELIEDISQEQYEDGMRDGESNALQDR